MYGVCFHYICLELYQFRNFFFYLFLFLFLFDFMELVDFHASYLSYKMYMYSSRIFAGFKYLHAHSWNEYHYTHCNGGKTLTKYVEKQSNSQIVNVQEVIVNIIYIHYLKNVNCIMKIVQCSICLQYSAVVHISIKFLSCFKIL